MGDPTMIGRLPRLMLFGLALSVAAPVAAGAHHSGAMFDREKVQSLTGTLKEVDWSNPHIHLVLAVPDAGGEQSWWFESSPPAWFQHAGIKRADFAKGLAQKVTIDCHPIKDGRNGGALIAVKFADGSQIKLE